MTAPELRLVTFGAHDELIEGLRQRVDDEQDRLDRVLEGLPTVLAAASTEELRRGLVSLARDLCEASVALFLGEDEPDDEATAVTGEHPFVSPPVVRQAPLLAAAFLADEVLHVHDVTRVGMPDLEARYGVVDGDRVLRAWLAAPVQRRRDEAGTADGGRHHLGVLLVGHTRPGAFDPRHARRLAALADHLAAALEATAAAEEQRRLASGLQQTLLPPNVPQLDNVDIAARYRAAGEDSVIGGDFYDVFPTRDGRWVAAIGDVCGGGPEAAAVTGIARYTLRAVAREDPSPGRALAVLNDAVLTRQVEHRFCTGVLACLEPAVDGHGEPLDVPELCLRWSNAGHPPPLVLRDDGTVETLDQRLGPLLGVIPDAEFPEATVELRAGDALVLYTDGVIEARPPGGAFFGEEGLVEVVAGCTGRTADGIARRVELAVIDHVGSVPDDDVAILVIRARPRPTAQPGGYSIT